MDLENNKISQQESKYIYVCVCACVCMCMSYRATIILFSEWIEKE